jgi:predicted trehalose synthase
MRKLFITLAIVAAGCTATTQQTAQTAPATQPSEFKNLQVLPRDITRDQLMQIMRSFTRSLGVRCNECHVVVATEPKEELDFPSDAKEDKQIARGMIRMTNDINQRWLQQLPADHRPAAGEMRVTCWTCHRGSKEPEAAAPPRPAS